MAKFETVLDFSKSERIQWYVINDGVMGGISQSDLLRTDQQTGVFTGELSLENNGGFASVRANLGERDLARFQGIQLRVRGDGRTYQLRLRTNESFDGVAYRAFFDTREGEWVTPVIAFDEFLPTFRGRILSDMPPLDVARIQQVAFMLADKNPGAFALEIDYVHAIEFQKAIEP